jgi:hypothetical protein
MRRDGPLGVPISALCTLQGLARVFERWTRGPDDGVTQGLSLPDSLAGGSSDLASDTVLGSESRAPQTAPPSPDSDFAFTHLREAGEEPP